MANALHDAFRKGGTPEAEAEQLDLIAQQPELLRLEDESWEGWLPVHHAGRWAASQRAVESALAAYPEAAKTGSKGGYEPLHLAAMGGADGAVRALVAIYPEGTLKKDGNGRTPLDEAREGGFDAIVAEILALPGVREADEAEQQLRAARAEELMHPDADEPCSMEEEPAHGAADDFNGSDGSLAIPGRSLANRMLRAAGNALWRREESPDVGRPQIGSFFTERAKYIPLRLELNERRLLRLLEGVLHVSEYTDRVDAPAVKGSAKRRQVQLRELHAILSGLLLACDYEKGQEVLESCAYAEYENFFQMLFETVRRYKIMNPEKMRDTYEAENRTRGPVRGLLPWRPPEHLFSYGTGTAS
jgi:hypothetical protein